MRKDELRDCFEEFFENCPYRLLELTHTLIDNSLDKVLEKVNEEIDRIKKHKTKETVVKKFSKKRVVMLDDKNKEEKNVKIGNF